MSGWTIAQLLAIPVDEVPIQEPIEGTVKVSMPVKTHEKYGDSQFLVIEDGTGEIAVDYKAPKPETKLLPVEKGEKVRIHAQEYKGKLTGAKKEVYQGKNGRAPKITVYGNRLTNLSRSPEPAPRPVQTPRGATSSPAPAHHQAMTEPEAVEAYWRIFERQAAKLSRFMVCEDFEGFMAGATEDVKTLCRAATAEVFRGILAGRVTPDTRREAPAQQQSQPRQDDPFEGLLDEEDISF